jgi:hypothetical protein
MTCDDLCQALPEYWAGALSPAARAGVEAHLERCAACRAEAESLGVLWQQLGTVRDETPSPQVQVRFDAMLAAWREGTAAGRVLAFPARQALRASAWAPAFLTAAAILLLATGVTVGRLWPDRQHANELSALRDELRNMRQVVALSLLQQQSASERLRGVTWSHQLEQPGEEVIDALLDTLRHDGNVNVRLAAIDALRQFTRTPHVRDGLLEAVGRQDSPLVQIELIDLFVELRDRGSRDALRALAEDDRVNGAVRERARWGLTQIG